MFFSTSHCPIPRTLPTMYSSYGEKYKEMGRAQWHSARRGPCQVWVTYWHSSGAQYQWHWLHTFIRTNLCSYPPPPHPLSSLLRSQFHCSKPPQKLSAYSLPSREKKGQTAFTCLNLHDGGKKGKVWKWELRSRGGRYGRYRNSPMLCSLFPPFFLTHDHLVGRSSAFVPASSSLSPFATSVGQKRQD